MLKIYGVYRSRATRTLWLAGELGIAFEQVPVIQGYRLPDPLAPDAPLNTRTPSFLKINPAGQIPSIDDDGFVMHESLAINLYLARKYGGPLAPASVQEEGQMIQWSLWAATNVESPALDVMYNRVAKPVAERDPAKVKAGIESLRAPFAVIDGALAGKDWLVGNRFTVADINVAEVMRYAQAAPELFDIAPNAKRWLAACQSRPAFKAMMARREQEPA